MTRARTRSTMLLLLGLSLPSVATEVQQTQNDANSPADRGNAAMRAKPLRVRVSQGVSASLLVKRVDPEYPKDVKRKRIQGLVSLRILISREGDVSQVTLVSGHPVLASLAMDAVKQWKYKPYLLDGQPVEVETTLQINFTLAGG